MKLETLLLAAAVAALAIWAHYRFWSWRLWLPPPEDERLAAPTRDGWSLALHRRRPRGEVRPVPVLLLHGIAANHACMDFGMDRLSLAAHLAEAGFDCFSLDLRGHGGSRPAGRARRRWSFDTYVEEDVPAAVEAVLRATGARQVAIVGHSQGALLGMAACAALRDRVAALVAIAGPVHFQTQRLLAFAARFGFVWGGKLNRFLARSFAPFAGWWHPPVSQVAWNANNVDGPVYRRVLVNVVEDIPLGVLRQFGDWIRTDTWRSRDGAVDYRAALPACRQPALFVAAVDDVIAPPGVVRAAYEAWGAAPAAKALFVAGRQSGCECEYGHSDLLFGRSAPDDVFPHIASWLASNVPARAALQG
jgi:pimeloyl-ACP methyl ester carboxylesterase